MLQADLTAVAPGPVPYRLARELRLLADQESRGGAAVFRFSGPSLRRAFDAGWSAADVHRWLEHHATTAPPQPLAYLIDDIARQHGSIRVGPANAYVRIADPAQVASILTHPDASVLGLRELAPGVLVAAAEPYEVVDFLHRIGHSPAGEDSSGRSVTAPDPLRAPRRAAHRPRPDVQAGEAAAAVLSASSTGTNADPVAGRSRRRRPTPAAPPRTWSGSRRRSGPASPSGSATSPPTAGPPSASCGPCRPTPDWSGARTRPAPQLVSIPLSRVSSVGPR